MSLGLTPAGEVRWTDSGAAEIPERLEHLERAFDADWREALFTLAAEKIDTRQRPAVRYWQSIAERHLTALCHLPDKAASLSVEPPTSAESAALVEAAPPMIGGEYLSAARLQHVWTGLNDWVSQAAPAAGGLSAFLRERAPEWHQVGRVCFHLAENRNDAARPFAFMATYSARFGATGRARHLPLRRALEQYAGENNRSALITLLSPIEQAAAACDWLREMVDSGDVYRPMAWTPDRAYRLLRSVPELEESGLSVRLPDWWRKRPRPQVSVTVGEAPSQVGADAVLDFRAEVALGGEPLSEDELNALLGGDANLVLLKGQWVEVDRDRLDQAIEHWDAVRQAAGNGGISFVEGMRLLAGASADLQGGAEVEAERPWVHVEAGDGMREILAGMRRPETLAAVDDGELQGTLRPYQRDGVAWLCFLTRLGLGACLADDMGLGKTIQVLALLLSDRALCQEEQQRRPSLLVIPASLLGNWRAEAARFAPSLDLRFLHPSETDRETLADIANAPARFLAGADLAVTTYAMLARQPWLADLRWRLVILDEAQAIKNPGTLQSRSARKLQADARVAMTGTPVENHAGDLWALFDFLNPGLLGSRAVFQRFVKTLQQREAQQFAPLRRLVAPYILRRLKTDRRIIDDLPDKTEAARYCRLTRTQAALYERVVRSMQRGLESAEGIERRGLVLQTLMRLKQVCNHPSQLSGDGVYEPSDSGKFERVAEICAELAERQERALVFTQFREIIDPLSDHLAEVFGRSGLALHGGTGVGRRRALVEAFQRDDGPPFFVLSLKAGGTGLNLTAASHVIHFDRWWNPAVENQATDRAFRIGQRRNVLIHKFIVSGTVEERIDRMLTDKSELANDLLEDGREMKLTELADDELLDLVRLDITRARA